MLATILGTLLSNYKSYNYFKGFLTFPNGNCLECCLYYKEGEKYFGKKESGYFGKLTFKGDSSKKYTGEVNTDGEPHGKGILKLKDKTIYQGNFQNGEYHGLGKLISSEGEIISNFENNKPKGNSFYDKKKHIIKGDISVGGYCSISNKDNDYSFQIQLTNTDFYDENDMNKINGVGSYYFSNNTRKYQGTFENSTTKGEGNYVEPSQFISSNEYYSINFKEIKLPKNFPSTEFYVGSDKNNYTMNFIFSISINNFLRKIENIENNVKRVVINVDNLVSAYNNLKVSIKESFTFLNMCSNSKEIYTGGVSNGFLDGEGEYINQKGKLKGKFLESGREVDGIFEYTDGKTEIGIFENGALKFGPTMNKENGINKGSEKYENGNIYNGEFSEDGFPQGQGTLTLNDNSTFEKYVGKFEKGQLTGKVEAFPKKNKDKNKDTIEKYIIEFVNGDPNLNNGTIHYKDKRVYLGELNETFLPDGKGTITYPNEDILKGDFEDGFPTNGILTFHNGDIFDGNVYNNGKPKSGELNYSKSNKEGYKMFSGDFNDKCERHGTGNLKFVNGNEILAQFENNKIKSTGHLTFANGNEYLGEFDDKYQPTGKVTTINDEVKNINKQNFVPDKTKTEVTDFVEKTTKINSLLKTIDTDLKFLKDKGKDVLSFMNEKDKITGDKDLENKLTALKLLKDNVDKEVEKTKIVEQTKNLLSKAKEDLKSIKELAKEKDVTSIQNGITDAEKEKDINNALKKAKTAQEHAAKVLAEVERSKKLKKIAWGVAGVAGVAGVSYYLYNKFKKSKKESSAARSSAKKSKSKSAKKSAKKSKSKSAKKSERKSKSKSERKSHRSEVRSSANRKYGTSSSRSYSS
jgi:hypothetical protein